MVRFRKALRDALDCALRSRHDDLMRCHDDVEPLRSNLDAADLARELDYLADIIGADVFAWWERQHATNIRSYLTRCHWPLARVFVL